MSILISSNTYKIYRKYDISFKKGRVCAISIRIGIANLFLV